MKPQLYLLVALAALLPAAPVQAAFHLMEIEQVIGGVNGETTAQAVQLKMRAFGQNVLNGTVRVVARDAGGANPVVVSTLFANPFPPIASDDCREILLATDSFASRTTPAAVRDFSMTPIPTSYLGAGSLTFESANGAFTYWRVSWGGGSYTGSTLVTLDNDADGNTTPPVPGVLPSSNNQALRFTPACPAASTNSAAQYANTAGAAVFVNHAGASFTVNTVVAAPIPVLPTWGWAALASALGLAGFALSRRRTA